MSKKRRNPMSGLTVHMENLKTSNPIRMKEQKRLEELIAAMCDALPPGIFLSIGNVFGGTKKNTPAQRRKARRNGKRKS